MSEAVAQHSLTEGRSRIPSCALYQAADELEVLAFAVRSKRMRGALVHGAAIRIQDRLEIAATLAPGSWSCGLAAAIGLLVGGTTSNEMPVSPGLRVAIRGLVREARRRARRFDAAAAIAEAAQ